MTEEIDLGLGYSYSFIGWAPDRTLNPQYEGIPDVDRYGIIIRCPHGEGAVTFAGNVQQKIEPGHPSWTVVSFEPLTISPSVHRTECGCHGFIRDGKWVPA